MAEMKVIRYSEQKYYNPVAIVGFPGVGLVGSILTSFVIRELDMEVIAAVTSPEFPPYTLIQNGNPYPPIRVYGCKRENTSEYCGDLIIVTSEIAVRPEHHYDLNETLMGLFKELGIVSVIALEGIAQFEEEKNIFACGSSPASKERINELGIKRLDDGLVRGLTGVMLYEAFYSGMEMVAMLCPANPALPDPRSAARILEPLSKLMPELKIDAEPLYKEAEEIENKIKQQQEYGYSVAPKDIQQLYG
ncbi:MAG: PAC2 family protein [Methanomassiliicoccaceae archaeon]|nr:PAC2 family protein [Methanomassiliicoccaceae archaeon]